MSRQIKITDDPLSGARVYEYSHRSGAVVLAVEENTQNSSASVSIPYGGGTSEIRLDGFRYLPAFPGSAHFAEHMIFTGGRLDRFCALGADANAETTMTGTTYYVSAGEKFLYSLGDLAYMVIKPTFGKDELEKEREIILREKSDDDDAFTKGRNALTDTVYSRGSIRREIIGDVKSIKKMDADLLRGIYSCAYMPGVMSFAAVSSFDHRKIFDMIDAALFGNDSRAVPNFKRIKSVRRVGTERQRGVKALSGSGLVFFGIYPDMSVLGDNYAKKQVYSSMLESMIFDRTEHIGGGFLDGRTGINGGFRSDAEIFADELMLTAGLSCEDARGTAGEFISFFDGVKTKGARNLFPNVEAKRRSLVAEYLSVYDSPSDLSLTMSEYSAAGARFTDVGTELIRFDENDFFAFADRVLEGAEVFAVYGAEN